MSNTTSATPPPPFPEGKISITDLIQFRIALGSEDQIESEYQEEIIRNLDKVILEFTRAISPAQGN